MEWNWETAEKVMKFVFGSGTLAFLLKFAKKGKDKIEENKKIKEQDRQLFLRLVEEVGIISNDVKGIKTKMKSLEDSQRNRLNAQGLAFWESDKEGKAVYVSPALQVMLGQPEQKIRDYGWAALMVEKDKDRIYKSWKFSIETLTVFDEIYTFNMAGGGTVKVHGMAFHSKDENGNYAGSFGQLKIIEDETGNE